MAPELFSSWSIGTLQVPNRLVRSATWEGLATADGAVTDRLIEATAALARGGVGLIITGYAYITRSGLGLHRQTGIDRDELIPGWQRLTSAVHEAGGLVALQVVHAGGQTRPSWTGEPLVGPSRLRHPAFDEPVEELSVDQIGQLITAFADAAGRAKAAGFDAVQLHAAHGYLINQFLSPSTNQRNDDYGGDLASRFRFCREVLEAVRARVGDSFPVLVKLNSEDAIANGLQLEEAVIVAGWLGELGIDAIEVSGGVPAAGKLSSARAVRSPDDEAYFLANARAIKKVVDCPVILVGGLRSRARVEQALQWVDAVAMSRPFIRQPDLANLWRQGLSDSSQCVSCSKCFGATLQGGLACGVVAEKG